MISKNQIKYVHQLELKKYRKQGDKHVWDDITKGRKKYIGDQNPEVVINLGLVENIIS